MSDPHAVVCVGNIIFSQKVVGSWLSIEVVFYKSCLFYLVIKNLTVDHYSSAISFGFKVHGTVYAHTFFNCGCDK